MSRSRLAARRLIMFAIFTMSVLTAATADAASRSIRSWVSCTGSVDDTSGTVAAFSAARNSAFTLIVDCPVLLFSARAIDRAIFIDNGTSVQFAGAGKFIVNNLYHPAFVIANSSNISLVNWNVEWDGTVPVSGDMAGYKAGSTFVQTAGTTQPAGPFNDITLTNWLRTNRGITFDPTQGRVTSIWHGPTNLSAVFYITGDCNNIVFSGLNLYVPPWANGSQFMPMAVSLLPNWKSNSTVYANTPITAQYVGIPNGVTFSGVTLDGTLMGFQGSVQNTLFENVVSRRYGDLQDAVGGNVGGVGKWFPPPHLFYLNYDAAGDPALFNRNVHIRNVIDAGPRSGTARDKGAGDTISGYAPSLKLGCRLCSVDGYSSSRPDGFLDLLPSSYLTVSNVDATFNSAFLNNLYPAGIRFPSVGYSNVVFSNLSLTDTASTTLKAPVGNATDSSNNALVFTNIHAKLNSWAGSGTPTPTIAGTTNSVDLHFAMGGPSVRLAQLTSGVMIVTVMATPAGMLRNASTGLSWTATNADQCLASGAWTGALGAGGTRIVTAVTAGTYAFNINCRPTATAPFVQTGVFVTAQ